MPHWEAVDGKGLRPSITHPSIHPSVNRETKKGTSDPFMVSVSSQPNSRVAPRLLTPRAVVWLKRHKSPDGTEKRRGEK